MYEYVRLYSNVLNGGKEEIYIYSYVRVRTYDEVGWCCCYSLLEVLFIFFCHKWDDARMWYQLLVGR